MAKKKIKDIDLDQELKDEDILEEDKKKKKVKKEVSKKEESLNMKEEKSYLK